MSRIPLLIMFVGVPGSGKTTFATQLAQEIKAVHLNSDSLRLSMWGSVDAIRAAHTDSTERALNNQLVSGALDYVAGRSIAAGYDVIYDCNANGFKEREAIRNAALNNGGSAIVIRLNTPTEIAVDRLVNRTAGAGQNPHTVQTATEVTTRFAAAIEEPAGPEFVIEISGVHVFNSQYQQFNDGLRSFTMTEELHV